MSSAESVASPPTAFVHALTAAVVRASEEKLARDTVIMDLRELVDSFDALVVTSGTNDRQVRAICEEVERQVALSTDVRPTRMEGFIEGEWIAMDYGDVIVHIFSDEAREYYDLEHLWSAAPTVRYVNAR